MTTENLHDRLAGAMKNHDPACPSDFVFDSSEVEVSGVFPGPARGLYALKHELGNEINGLLKRIEHLKATADAAETMAHQIIAEAYPNLADRKGFILGANWTFFAIGPSAERKHMRGQHELAKMHFDRETHRTGFGDESVDDDDLSEGAADFRGLLDGLAKSLGRRAA